MIAGLAARLTTEYFTRCHKRSRWFVPGPRPAPLPRRAASMRRWKSYLARLERTNPIHLADRFLAELRRGSVSTYAQVAAHFGVSTAKVCYFVALVQRLPADFVEWLRACEDPAVLAFCCERRLRPVTRVKDEGEQRARLEQMVEEAQRTAAIA